MRKTYSNKSVTARTATSSNPLKKLEELDQSIWIDFIRRGMISSGELQRLIEDDGLNRPNTFIKVPGTKDGVPAIQQHINEGINVNVTLLFGLSRYREVVEAYLAGLEERMAGKLTLKNVASVASFFLSRSDYRQNYAAPCA